MTDFATLRDKLRRLNLNDELYRIQTGEDATEVLLEKLEDVLEELTEIEDAVEELRALHPDGQRLAIPELIEDAATDLRSAKAQLEELEDVLAQTGCKTPEQLFEHIEDLHRIADASPRELGDLLSELLELTRSESLAEAVSAVRKVAEALQ